MRVLVADDSPTMRAAIVALLGTDPRVQVVGEARDGAAAVALAEALRPDVITMDVVMPGLDGLAATAAIMSRAPARIVIVCAVSSGRDVDLSFQAMAAGALELVPKPSRSGEALRAWARHLADTIVLMAEVPVIARRGSVTTVAAQPGLASRRIEIAGVVASTGGPVAVSKLLAALPRDLPIPVLVAQHVGHGFAPGLVRWLGGATGHDVVLASAGERCRASRVHVVPDDAHVEVDRGGVLRVTKDPAAHESSGDRLLRSLAASYGDRAAGAVLTGMGEDGAQGLLALARAGGPTFAQDEASCLVDGMPRAAAALGAAQARLPVEEIAAAVAVLAGAARATRRPV